MELNLARLVYEQADPTAKDSKPVARLEQMSISLPDKFAGPSNPNLHAVESAMKQEGFMVQVMA